MVAPRTTDEMGKLDLADTFMNDSFPSLFACLRKDKSFNETFKECQAKTIAIETNWSRYYLNGYDYRFVECTMRHNIQFLISSFYSFTGTTLEGR